MSVLEETMSAIGRVRRAMPRNPDVMLICDELEKRMTQIPLPMIKPDGGDVLAAMIARLPKKRTAKASRQKNGKRATGRRQGEK
jgi:hypothetical protein